MPIGITVVNKNGRGIYIDVDRCTSVRGLKEHAGVQGALILPERDTDRDEGVGDLILDSASTLNAYDISDGATLFEQSSRRWFITRKNGTYARDTPLHLAASDGRLEVAKLIVQHYPEGAAKKDDDDLTPLHAAAQHGHFPVVEFLLKCYPQAVRMKSKPTEATALLLAADRGCPEVVELLLSYQPDGATERTNTGLTAYHFATCLSRHAVLKVLLQHDVGAERNVKVKDPYGATPFYYAVTKGDEPSIEMLLRRFPELATEIIANGQTVYHYAAWNGQCDVLQLLFRHYPDGIHSKDHKGQTPMHHAAEANQRTAYGLLRMHYPEGVLDKDNDGYTPPECFYM